MNEIETRLADALAKVASELSAEPDVESVLLRDDPRVGKGPRRRLAAALSVTAAALVVIAAVLGGTHLAPERGGSASDDATILEQRHSTSSQEGTRRNAGETATASYLPPGYRFYRQEDSGEMQTIVRYGYGSNFELEPPLRQILVITYAGPHGSVAEDESVAGQPVSVNGDIGVLIYTVPEDPDAGMRVLRWTKTDGPTLEIRVLGELEGGDSQLLWVAEGLQFES